MKKFLLALSLLLLPTVAFAADKDHPWGDAANKVTDFAISKMNSLIDATSKALPTVTKYAMEVTSLNCLFSILTGVLLLVAAGILAYLSYFGWRRCFSICKEKGDAYWAGHEVPFGALGGIAGIASCGLAISAGTQLFDFWSYVCVVHPDLYLIHLAVQKVLGG